LGGELMPAIDAIAKVGHKLKSVVRSRARRAA